MKRKFGAWILLTATLFAIATATNAQKRDVIKPPPETATLVEFQKWFADSFAKYASYKTRSAAVAISSPKFDGCKFSFEQVRKFASTSTATMGATRTVNSVKDDISFDMSLFSSDGVNIVDHIYPEVQTLELKFANDGRIVEIGVKSEASAAFKSALIQMRRLCTAKS